MQYRCSGHCPDVIRSRSETLRDTKTYEDTKTPRLRNHPEPSVVQRRSGTWHTVQLGIGRGAMRTIDNNSAMCKALQYIAAELVCQVLDLALAEQAVDCGL